MTRSEKLLFFIEGITKEQHFKTRTEYHINLVRKWLRKIIDLGDPRLDPDILQSEMDHDSSKFQEPEYDPYLHVAWKYYLQDHGIKYDPPAEIKNQMDAATLHHVTTNKHHPEYWAPNASINTQDRDKPPSEIVDATKMPLSYVASMVADWLAMSDEKQTCPYDWVDKNINIRWSFTDDQKQLIYNLFDLLWKRKF